MVDTWSALPLVKKRYKIYFQQIVELLNLQQIQNTVFGNDSWKILCIWNFSLQMSKRLKYDSLDYISVAS